MNYNTIKENKSVKQRKLLLEQNMSELNNIKIGNYAKIDSSEVLENWSKHPDGCKCGGCLIRKNSIYKNNMRKDLLVLKHK